MAIAAAALIVTYSMISVVVFIIATTERRTRLFGHIHTDADYNHKLSSVSVASNMLQEPLITSPNSHKNNFINTTTTTTATAGGGGGGGRHDSYTGSHIVNGVHKKSSRGCVGEMIVSGLLSALFYTRLVEVDVMNAVDDE